MIMERFNGVFFIGDDMLRHVYAAFNVLLRKNLANGGMEPWRMTDAQKSSCRCENQLINPDCAQYIVSGSSIVEQHGSQGSPYSCQRTVNKALDCWS